MESLPLGVRTPAPSRREVLVIGIAVPASALVLLALGAGLLAVARDHGQPKADVAVALTAALAGVALTVWWAGGVAMLMCALLARRLSWTGLERTATRWAPALPARTAGALLGLQLVAVPAAQAGEPVDPFWSAQTQGTRSQAPEAGGRPASEGPGHTAALPGPAATGPGAPETPEAPVLPPGPVIPAAEEPALAAPPAAERIADGALAVVSGDTLWDLTAQLLGPGADTGRIAVVTAAWSEHNDFPGGPDLIHPGDRLRVPPQLLELHRSSSPSGAPS